MTTEREIFRQNNFYIDTHGVNCDMEVRIHRECNGLLE